MFSLALASHSTSLCHKHILNKSNRLQDVPLLIILYEKKWNVHDLRNILQMSAFKQPKEKQKYCLKLTFQIETK